MKVMLIETLGDGGIAHYTLNLANSLTKKESRIILFTSKYYEFANEVISFKVYQRMFKLGFYLIKLFPGITKETGFISLLRRVIKLLEYPLNTIEALFIAMKHKIHIVHFQSVNEIELLMIMVFKLIGAKLVFTIHNVNPRHGRIKWYHSIIYRFMYSLCDHIIIHSHIGKGEVAELFALDPDKISVIPHGDYKFFLPETTLTKDQAKAILGISNKCKTILFFGAIRSNKGLANILRALSHIKKHIPDVKLLIIGEPCESYQPYRAIIEKEYLKEEVFERLRYIPHHEVSLYFTASDVVVLPYNEVTQSGVLQIAYAFEKPVVASAIGGFNETVASDKNGYLVPPHEIKMLAEKTIEILSDENKMNEMGNYSRYLSDTKYSWDSIAQQTLQVYSELF